MRTALCFEPSRGVLFALSANTALWNAKVCKQMESPTLLPALIVFSVATTVIHRQAATCYQFIH